MKRLRQISCLVAAAALFLSGLPVSSYGWGDTPPAAYEEKAPTPERPQRYTGFTDDASDPPGELIIADALILRPAGVLACLVGLVSAATFVVPWGSTSDSYDRAQRALVQKPFDYTFKRPLGDVDH